jgi:hypothetical protein
LLNLIQQGKSVGVGAYPLVAPDWGLLALERVVNTIRLVVARRCVCLSENTLSFSSSNDLEKAKKIITGSLKITI